MNGMHQITGKPLSGMDHVRQSINNILTTPLGSRVMRRDYGSVLPDLIDQPLNETTILRLYAATATALIRWEPRLQLSSIRLNTQGASAVIEVGGTVDGADMTADIPVRGY